MEETVVMPDNCSAVEQSSSSPVHTDSLVTVRLSDVKLATEPEVEEQETPSSPNPPESISSSLRSRSTSSSTGSDSLINDTVDWEELDKSEEQEPRDEGTDEATALLLARLEQENAALAGNPKSGMTVSPRLRSNTRPPSVQQLKKLVNGRARKSLRYSQVPAPQMTELEFWAALVADYPQTAQRLPTLTSNKIRGGVPPPLRGVVWPSISGARDALLHEEYHRLCGETSPYEGLIGKDVGRSFPNVEMFREKDGEGQQMLGRVLKCFSLYDNKIGYCQGLGFVVGPLLMHMNDTDAFCVLVRSVLLPDNTVSVLTLPRLMEHYDLRSCYLPDLSGLHLRIYQFQQLLALHLPEVSSHLESLKVEPLYVSQWFLSFFAVTCPLPMLLRIYDVILSEGATETLMRVALSLMKRNQRKILSCNEFEDAMQFLLSRGLWDTYAQQADELVTDFVSLTTLVTRESLKSLEISFKDSKGLAVVPSLKNAASQLLGRFWAGSTHSFSKSGNNLVLALPSPSRPTSSIRRIPSKQSFSSTLNSFEGTSETSTLATEMSLRKSETIQSETTSPDRSIMGGKERELEIQIEDLLKAMGDMQRQQSSLLSDLQREREERQDDRDLSRALLESFKLLTDDLREMVGGEATEQDKFTEALVEKASLRFSAPDTRRASILQSKHQLRDEAAEWRGKHDLETRRCQELMKQLDERETEQSSLKDQLKEARARYQDSHKDKQRMERMIHDLRCQRSPVPESPNEATPSPIAEVRDHRASFASTGLREFKLGRADTLKSMAFSKRSSSLTMQPVLATESHQPAAEDALLLELVNAKTSEAVARQELEEVKGKLDALKKIVSGPAMLPAGHSRSTTVETNDLHSSYEARTPIATPKSSISGGFFAAWGRKTATTSPS
jgi:Rab-GTPase-TBC domain